MWVDINPIPRGNVESIRKSNRSFLFSRSPKYRGRNMKRMIDRVKSCISEHPEGISDASIRLTLNGKHHQEINTCCRKLASQGYILRNRLNRPILNFPTDETNENV
jgi:hypothetical protein